VARLVCNRLFLDLLESDLIDPNLRPVQESEISIDAHNVRELIRQLDHRFPGVGNKLQHGLAIAIDGEIFSDALLEPLGADSEVYFIPAIEGG